MLNNKDIERIKKLMDLDLSDYKIGKITGHSPNTINKYRKIINKIKVNQKLGEIVHFENPLPKLRQKAVEIDDIISSQNMQYEDQKVWQRRLDGLNEILEKYEGGVSEDLKKRNNKLEAANINLRNENKAKDDLITKYQQEIS